MERIRELRKERGLSQAKLAVMADMDPATLNRLERGTGNPNLNTLQRVADALGVTITELLGGAPPKDLSPLLPLEQRGELLEDFLKLVNAQLERFTGGEDPKLVVGGLASAVVSLVEWVKPPFEGEAKRLAGLYIRVLAEADPNSKYLPLERKRQVEKFLSTLEETPEESRKA
jgi:transcriptional regulator with XRE-family HTH domain